MLRWVDSAHVSEGTSAQLTRREVTTVALTKVGVSVLHAAVTTFGSVLFWTRT